MHDVRIYIRQIIQQYITHFSTQYFTCSNHEFAINIHILFMIEIKYCVIDYVDYKKRNTKFSRIQFTFPKLFKLFFHPYLTSCKILSQIEVEIFFPPPFAALLVRQRMTRTKHFLFIEFLFLFLLLLFFFSRGMKLVSSRIESVSPQRKPIIDSR